jgi:ABC-type transport system involved in multi-copper enzyme maturation permease subunit
MKGLFRKILTECRWPVFWFSAGLAIIMALLTSLLPKVLGDIDRIFDRLPFVKPLITALLGVDPGEQMTAQMSQAFLWVHPTVLTLMWAHAVMYCTRVPAGEIDRGTADFLLGLPVSRWQLFLTESLGWLFSGAIILAVGYLGHAIASLWLQPKMMPGRAATLFILLNMFSLYMVVGGFAFLVSALSDRRGRAVGVIFAVLLMSFLLNFVAQFWDPFKPESAMQTLPAFSGVELTSEETGGGVEAAAYDGVTLATFSLMDYYRPAIIIQSQQFPGSDIAVLLTLFFLMWLSAGLIFHRRSICTT